MLIYFILKNIKNKKNIYRIFKINKKGGYGKNPIYLSYKIYNDLEKWGATDIGFGKVLRDRLFTEKNIKIIERTMITTLLEEDGNIIGAIGFKLDEEEVVVIKAKSVILCTGAGGFKPNGFPIRSLTFDGYAMAYRIGAKISGKEFIDTHNTNNETPAYCWGPWERMWNMGLPKSTDGPVDGGGMALDLTMFYDAHKGLIPVKMEMGPPPGGDKPPMDKNSDKIDYQLEKKMDHRLGCQEI